jgi:hypothetical protein
MTFEFISTSIKTGKVTVLKTFTAQDDAEALGKAAVLFHNMQNKNLSSVYTVREKSTNRTVE